MLCLHVNTMLTNKQLSKQILALDNLIDTYNKSKEKLQRDFSKYESNYLERLKQAIHYFQKLTIKAMKLTKFHKKLPDRCYFKELQKEEMKQKHLIEQRKKLNFNIF